MVKVHVDVCINKQTQPHLQGWLGVGGSWSVKYQRGGVLRLLKREELEVFSRTGCDGGDTAHGGIRCCRAVQGT
jgi:hypothetical protein